LEAGYQATLCLSGVKTLKTEANLTLADAFNQ
jgi:hypothetical protein